MKRFISHPLNKHAVSVHFIKSAFTIKKGFNYTFFNNLNQTFFLTK